MTLQEDAGLPQTPQLVTIRQAADMLAVSARWVEYALAREELRSVRVGRRRLIRLSDIAAFIDERVDEPGEDAS